MVWNTSFLVTLHYTTVILVVEAVHTDIVHAFYSDVVRHCKYIKLLCTATGSTGFGTTTSTFGGQPASTSLFGAAANPTPATGSMFGGGTSVFGQQQQPQQQQQASTFCEFFAAARAS